MPIKPLRGPLRTFRYAVYFDGVDDYVSLFTTNFPSFTIMVWARLATSWWPSPGYRALVSKGWYKNVAGVGGIYVTSTTGYGGLLRDSVGNVYDVVSSALPSLLGSFRCIALTSEAKLYVDGVLRVTVTIPNPINTNTYAWNVGRDPIETPRVFPGYIYQVLFYTRILDTPDISWNVNYPDNPVRNGLVLWLKADPQYIKDIDGDGVLEWIDLSGFGNHGKIYGAQLVELVKTAKRVLTPARVLRAVR
jgi:hypothetical protein